MTPHPVTHPTRPYAGRRVLLGVTGGIASYKSAWLARQLALAGAEVDVVMTRAATEFVGPITFEALTGRPVHTDIFGAGHALDHIRLARAAAAVVVAPATADFLARAAHGHADDLLSACLLATPAPVLLAPAMNDRMWAHALTQANVTRLRDIGYQIIEPDDGLLAVGEGSGPGRMPEPDTIFAYVGRLLEPPSVLAERRVVVTAGPTREPLDPVRFLSNRSSGRMGVELAAAAWRRKADVVLVAGPLSVAPPVGVTVIPVESTEEMLQAVKRALPDANVLVMAAAPADFGAAEPAAQKIKKGGATMMMELAPTPDILRSTRESRRAGTVIVGFALETQQAVVGGRAKLRDKALDMVVVNDATEPGAGFEVETNRVTLLFPDGREESLSLMPKRDVAEAVLDRVEVLLRGR